jgi:hypothetical protein
MSKNWSEKSREEIEKDIQKAFMELQLYKIIKPEQLEITKIFMNNKLNNKKNILPNRKQRRINAIRNKF